MNNEPSLKKQGISFSKPKHELVYAGSFCRCGAPLYKNGDDVILCKKCPNTIPKHSI